MSNYQSTAIDPRTGVMVDVIMIDQGSQGYDVIFPDGACLPEWSVKMLADLQRRNAELESALKNILNYLETDDIKNLDMRLARKALASNQEAQS